MAPLDPSAAKEMIAKYAATRKRLIDETYGINDTRSIWFSIEQLKNFVNGLDDNASGIRIYLGAYSNAAAVYTDQTTIVAIQTVDVGNGRHVDTLQDPHCGGPGNGSDPYNHGLLCPPDTGC